MAAVNNCAQVLKAMPHLQIPGFGEGELHKSVCKAVDYQSAQAPLANMIASVRKSYWDTDAISKAVDGGLAHVVSVDNAAGYAELWHQGGNWYMVTGADPSNPSQVMMKSPRWGVYEIPGVYKGMGLEEVTAYFTNKFFGPNGLAKGGCGCGGRS